jgi:hypothetical protein
MAQLTEDMIRRIANFRADDIDALTADLGAGEDVDAIAAPGALSLSIVRSTLAVDGTDAFTLAAPTFCNQRKIITCLTAANTPAGTLTISSPDTTTGFACPATFFFDVVGQEIELVATPALLWRCVRVRRAGDGLVTVGTTAITNKLWMRYNLSSTGTVGSTLPSGTVPGERVLLITKVVGLAGAGTITSTFNAGIDTAYTTCTPFDTVASATAVGDHAHLEWDGAAWIVLNQSGLTFA